MKITHVILYVFFIWFFVASVALCKIPSIVSAIIFDLDGTIADTEPIWHEGCRNMLRRHNVCITPPLECIIGISGIHLSHKCQLLKEAVGLTDNVEQLRAEIYDDLRSIYADTVTFIPGFIEFFASIPAHIKVAIASNCVDEFIGLSVRGLGLKAYFGDHIYGISCVGNRKKPDPAIYLFAAQQLDVEPCNCIAIEDSKTGVQSAKRAGMFCIGINTNQHKQDLLTADMVVDHFDEIDLQLLLSNESFS